MQYKFQNKVVLPRKTCEVHVITSLSIFSVAFLQFGLSLNWTRVRCQLLEISEVLPYSVRGTLLVHFVPVMKTSIDLSPTTHTAVIKPVLLGFVVPGTSDHYSFKFILKHHEVYTSTINPLC
jgi:hypothetical protein